MEGGGGGDGQCRRELEQRMRNIYVPLNVLLNQNIVDLQAEEPVYEEIPPSGQYLFCCYASLLMT